MSRKNKWRAQRSQFLIPHQSEEDIRKTGPSLAPCGPSAKRPRGGETQMAPWGASPYPFWFLPSHGHLNASNTTSSRPYPRGASCLRAPRATTQERQSGHQGCCSVPCSGPWEESLTPRRSCTLRTQSWHQLLVWSHMGKLSAWECLNDLDLRDLGTPCLWQWLPFATLKLGGKFIFQIWLWEWRI